MPSIARDQLFRLIKSMEPPEKRHFRIYANRTMGQQDRKFLQLFDALEKLTAYDEDALLAKLPPGFTRGQLPHLKRHLFRQLLTSLRLMYIQKHTDIAIREQIDFARILYSKGMYMEGLRLLERCKDLAQAHHEDILHLEILDFQKLIEARHITRSRQVSRKMDQLLLDATQRGAVTLAASELSNLNIQIQGYYIDHGHVKEPADEQQLQEAWLDMQPLPRRIETLGTFFEKVNRFQAHLWYNYIRLNLPAARENAAEWVALFRLNPQMYVKDPDLYMRGLYYLLTFNFLLNQPTEFARYLSEFTGFVDDMQEAFSPSSRLIAFQYLSLARLNQCLLQHNYAEAPALVAQIKSQLSHYAESLDEHRLLLFYYKFAYLHFVRGEYAAAIDELDQILQGRTSFLREDLHYNAHLLELLCRYHLGHMSLLDYRMTALQRLLGKGRDVSKAQRLALGLLKRIHRLPPIERLPLLRQFSLELEKLQSEPYEQKSLRYLDLQAWINGVLQPPSPGS